MMHGTRLVRGLSRVRALATTLQPVPPEPASGPHRVQAPIQPVAQLRGDQPQAIDWTRAMAVIREAEARFPVARPTIPEREAVMERSITHNLAKVVEDYPGLVSLLKLGIDLARWERQGHADIALRLDYQRDVLPKRKFYLQQGVAHKRVPELFSRNAPMMLADLDDWHIRVDYLRGMKFTPSMITRILSGNPWWLNYTVQEIDGRLGFLQKTFDLNGAGVRSLTVKCPQLITWGGLPGQIILNHTVLVEAMGFEKSELRSLVLKCPEILLVKYEEELVDTFNALHQDVGFSHALLLRHPKALLTPAIDLRGRIEFLQLVQRDQYNPAQPNFVSPQVLASLSDLEFCEHFRVNIDHFNRFLKTI